MRLFSAMFEVLMLPIAVAKDVTDVMRGEDPSPRNTRKQIRTVEDNLK